MSDIERLKRRYDLRAHGEHLRDVCEMMKYNTEGNFRVLEQATDKLTGPDKLYFRQGFLFRGGVLANQGY